MKTKDSGVITELFEKSHGRLKKGYINRILAKYEVKSDDDHMMMIR